MQTASKIETSVVSVAMIEAGEHLIGEFAGDENGPTLIVFGSIHGNEAAGVLALRRVAEKLGAAADKLKGRVYLFAGNTRAFAKGIRFIDSDLNRHWFETNILRNISASSEKTAISEDSEQHELLVSLCEILRTAKNEVYALDLHSTSAEGVPFATVGDTLRNRNFAQKFPITILLGIEEQLEGTLLEYLNNLGAVTLGFEGGQHYAEATVDAHEALVWLGLWNSGILKRGDFDDLDRYWATLKRATGCSRIVEVRYRHAITEPDGFEMLAGFNNFDPVRKGDHLADDRSGKIKAGENGLILMPLYQKLGEDGFFLGREVAPFWIWLSGLLRRMKIGSYIHLLPGVSISGAAEETLEINTAIARLFPLQIFHLLGFRKRRWSGKRLFVSRRKHDTESPFSARPMRLT